MGLFKNRKKQRTATEVAAQAAPVYVEQGDFDNLIAYINTIITPNHNRLAEDFSELRDEIATNGVVRDLRNLEKQHANLADHVSSEFNNLGRNGVATAINRLQREVLTDKQEEQSSGMTRAFMAALGTEPHLEPTLKGKVDAIVAHLGLDIQVQPEEVIKAKIVTKKVAAPKKKGRR